MTGASSDRWTRIESLATDGRILEAVGLLADLEPTDRSSERDRRAVALRHQAWEGLDRRPGRAEWPPAWDDPFPGEEGIPAITPDRIDGAVVGGAIVHHGCLRIDGLLGADDVAHFVAAIDEAFAARERWLAATEAGTDLDESVFAPFAPGRDRAEGFGRNGYIRTVDVPASLADLASAFHRTGLVAAIAEHLGEHPAMIANKWALRSTPSGKVAGDFHQDGAFLGEGIRTVNCWVALTDCGPGTGRPAIDLVAHRFDRVLPTGEGSFFDWAVSEAHVQDAAEGRPIQHPTFAAGDALLFDDRLAHRTTPGIDLGPRHALESWFVAPSSYSERHIPIVI